MSKRSLLASALMAPALVASSSSGCVVGAPPGFSDGDLWSVPLVAPLEDDLLLVPVSIHGEGPFLFMIDPDSPESSIEASLQASLDLYVSRTATERQTEDDHMSRIIIAEVKKMTIGDLKIRNMKVRVHDDGVYWSGNRRVRGILGRDVISDSLVYQFNRDKGMMYIGTQGNLKPPEDAPKLKFSQSYGNQRRYLAKVEINRKHKMVMHLDLGARTSMLWSTLIEKYKMPAVPIQAEIVDEYGTRRTISSGTIAGIVTANETETTALTMLPYADARVDEEDLDGVLGLNFWNKYNVTVNWHHKKFWMQPRNQDATLDAKARVERWGDQLTNCEILACLRPALEGRPEAVTMATAPLPKEEPAAEQPTGEGAAPTGAPVTPDPAAKPTTAVAPQPHIEAPAYYTLVIERDAPGTDFAYDALVGAVDAWGALLDLPVFLASFPSGASSLRLAGLAPGYGEAAEFVVLDINPVGTRGCEGTQCIYPIRNPQ
ncbi:MAG: hypothetical protein GY811_00660 [Myxococcales bacterium]|nr:hypothetical protein [Myxococcales bacterium]